MLSNLEPLFQSTLKIIRGTRDAVLPYTEMPCTANREGESSLEGGFLNASDLFSCFTANIIKEEVVFTR